MPYIVDDDENWISQDTRMHSAESCLETREYDGNRHEFTGSGNTDQPRDGQKKLHQFSMSQGMLDIMKASA